MQYRLSEKEKQIVFSGQKRTETRRQSLVAKYLEKERRTNENSRSEGSDR